MLLDEDGNKETEALYYLSNTGFARSTNWNSQISNKKTARFGSVWRMGSEQQSNDKGTWYIPTFDYVGIPDEGLYEEAKALYTSIEGTSKS